MPGDSSRGEGRTFTLPTQRTPGVEAAASRQGYVRRLQSESPSSGVALLPLLVFGLDLVLIAVTIVLALVARNRLGLFDPVAIDPGASQALAAPAIAAVWLAALAATGAYQHQVLGAGTDEYRRVITATWLTATAVGMGCYVLRYELPRGFFGIALVGGPVLLVVGRRVVRQLVKRARRRGLLSHRVMIVGSEPHVDEVASVLARESWLGYSVIGALVPGALRRVSTDGGVPIVGTAGRVAEMAQEVKADVVFFAGGGVASAAELRQAAWELEHTSCQVVVAPSLTDVSRERVRVRPVGGLPLLHLEKPRAAAAARRAKRTFDVVGSLCLLAALSPLLLVAVVQIRRHDRGPVLFRQQRIGRDGVTFDCLKFRTMVTDAEARLAEVHEQQGSSHGGLREDQGRPPDHPTRPVAAEVLGGRAPPARQRPEGRHEPRGSPPPGGARGRPLRPGDGPAPARPPRHDRAVAGLGPLGPLLGGGDPAGPLLRRQLVDGAGPDDSRPHLRRRRGIPRSLLTTTSHDAGLRATSARPATGGVSGARLGKPVAYAAFAIPCHLAARDFQTT